VLIFANIDSDFITETNIVHSPQTPFYYWASQFVRLVAKIMSKCKSLKFSHTGELIIDCINFSVAGSQIKPGKFVNCYLHSFSKIKASDQPNIHF
jgi:hypothetical protein